MALLIAVIAGCGDAEIAASAVPTDMAHAVLDLAPAHPLGAACATSQECIGDYGQGRCAAGVCVTAIYIDGRVNYCRALAPDDCCLSDNTNANVGTEACGVYASEFGAVADAGACDFGAFAPWGDKAR